MSNDVKMFVLGATTNSILTCITILVMKYFNF